MIDKKEPSQDDIDKAFRSIVDRLELFTLNDRPDIKLETISTGSLGLDTALGVGGLPVGRIIEISGLESSGKTTVALQAIAHAQKSGANCAFIDAEHALNPEYAEKLGVKLDKLAFHQPDNAEQGLDIAQKLVESCGIKLIVIDSVAALIPKAEVEGAMDDQQMGLQARVMGKALRKIAGPASLTKCTVIFINQIRQKVGITFGNPEVTPGGMALKFYSSVRIDIRRIAAIKDNNGNDTGNKVRAKVLKNKVAPPFKTAQFDIMFGSGISIEGEIIDQATELGMIKKSGAWYVVGEQKFQGRDNAMKFLKENPETLKMFRDAFVEYAKSNDAEILEKLASQIQTLSQIKKSEQDAECKAVDGIE